DPTTHPTTRPPGSDAERSRSAPSASRSSRQDPPDLWVPEVGGRDTDRMPELPEVQALVEFLTERAVGQVVARVDVASIHVLKTFDPPPTALGGLTVTAAARHGKFLDLDVDGLHLVAHLSRAG